MASWQSIVAASIDWEQAHVSFDNALKGLKPIDRGKRAKGFPHSVWDLVEHIRIAQHDLLDFLTNAKYSHDIEWPSGYWPKTAAPSSPSAWSRSLKQIRDDRHAIASLTTSGKLRLVSRIPHGTGQTYLRTILVAVDHTAYHVGQIVVVRQLIGSWKQ